MSAELKHRWSLGHNYLAGISAGDWWRLLRENRFRIDSLSQPSFALMFRKRTTPVTFFHGLPCELRNSGFPDPGGAVFISFRVSSATSGRTGILRVFLVFDE